MDEKRKKTATRQTLTARVKDVEVGLLGLVEHVDRLQDQQLVQHVELTALKQLLVEGRPLTAESFNNRCQTIYNSLAKVEAEKHAVSETESEGRESSAEAVVESTSEVPIG